MINGKCVADLNLQQVKYFVQVKRDKLPQGWALVFSEELDAREGR